MTFFLLLLAWLGHLGGPAAAPGPLHVAVTVAAPQGHLPGAQVLGPKRPHARPVVGVPGPRVVAPKAVHRPTVARRLCPDATYAVPVAGGGLGCPGRGVAVAGPVGVPPGFTAVPDPGPVIPPGQCFRQDPECYLTRK